MSITAFSIVFLNNNTIKATATIKDFDQTTLIDPDTHSITIYDAADKLMATITNPTRDSLGVFHTFYTIDPTGATGTWRLDWLATSGSLPSRWRGTFPVAA